MQRLIPSPLKEPAMSRPYLALMALLTFSAYTLFTLL